MSDSCGTCKCRVIADSSPVRPTIRRAGLIALVVDQPSGAEALGRSVFDGAVGEMLASTLMTVVRYAPWARPELCGEGTDILDVFSVHHAVARPTPGGKPPRIADVRACMPRLMDELTEAEPVAVLSTGAAACAALAQTGRATPITKWRGQMRWLTLKDRRVPWVATISAGSVLARPDLYRDISADVYKLWTQREPLPEPELFLLRPEDY